MSIVNLSIQLAVLLLHWSCLSEAKTDPTSASALSTSNSKPWWENKGLQFQQVDSDFSWETRQTGVTPFWKPGLGKWTHFKPKDSVFQSRLPAIPWTEGYMCKSLRQLNESAFELLSVYEPDALGMWFRFALDPAKPNREDGNLQHGHTFVKTDYRVTFGIPSVLPESMDPASLPIGFNSSRATIVQPNGATVSCPRWLPSQEQAKALENDEQSSVPKFFELWLAESLDGTEAEDRKIGLFLEYDFQTGRMNQLFRMHERALKNQEASFNPLPPPDGPSMNLKELADSLPKLALDLNSPGARALLAGKSLQKAAEVDNLALTSARVVKTGENLAGSEMACKVSQGQVPSSWWNPSTDSNDEHYWQCSFEDGAYARIPKAMSSEMDRVCLEFGCYLTNGRGLHRVLVVGSRREGSLHTLVYERWTPVNVNNSK